MTLDEPSYEHAIEEENYFVSMTDMMVGLVFIFIILLMYFALQFRDVTDELTGANRTRSEILRELQKSLKEKGVPVTIDVQNGVLHLPDSILFDKGRAELRHDGAAAAQKLAKALSEVLPCYTSTGSLVCKRVSPHLIESVYVEGHTDIDESRGVGCLQDNLALSACRSVATFRALITDEPSLRELCTVHDSGHCAKILSVSGYGAERLVAEGEGEEIQKKNRRIDLRVIMMTPDGGEAASQIREHLPQ